jgi:hypothetical protein
MPIKTITTTEYSCDLCGAMCHEPKPFRMMVDLGEHEAGPPAEIYIEFQQKRLLPEKEQPIVCKECTKDYLKKYLKHL